MYAYNAKILKLEIDIFNNFFPGLSQVYGALNFEEKEKRNSRIFEIYKEFNGPKLVVEKKLGGMGVSASDAVSIHRILGTISPSLALGASMHNFTVAFIDKLSKNKTYELFCQDLLTQVAGNNYILASGFAEGRPGANIMDASVKAVEVEDGYLVNGVKRPCTLSRSMDYFTAGVRVIDRGGQDTGRAVAVVRAPQKGISINPFWKASSFEASESEEVCLEDVFVPKHQMLHIDESVSLDPVEREGWLWFELLTTASYVGVISGLVVDLYKKENCSAIDRTRVVSGVETAVSALRGVAHEMDSDARSDRESLTARMLLIRYGIQQIIGEVKNLASELLGGMQFIQNPDLEYRIGALTGLQYHPPSRLSSSKQLDDYFLGKPLALS